MRAILLPFLLVACAGMQPADPVTGALAPPAGATVTEVVVPGPGDLALRAELLLPAAPTRPAVIALHGCSGIGAAGRPIRLPGRERDWAARLAALGHPVLAVDSFGSRGLGEACGVRGFPAGSFNVRRDDALAAAAWARAQPWGRGQAPVLLGWSHGGSTALAAWAAAPPGAISAAVAFYPGCIGAPEPRGSAAPLLMLLAADDDWTAPGPCEALAARHAEILRHTYPGARHGFDGLASAVRTRSLPNGREVSFGPEPTARADARERVAAFLASHAGGF
jgi:dienelactone hydrolase